MILKFSRWLFLLLLTFLVLLIDVLCQPDLGGESTPSIISPPTPSIISTTTEKREGVIELNEENIKYIIDTYEFVLILFYVKWCRFSVAVLPTFDKLYENITTELYAMEPNQTKVAITKMDCDLHEPLCEGYTILKYPTIKVIRHGSMEKLEYRKERTVEALAEYVKNELKDPTQIVFREEDIYSIETDKRKIIGIFSKYKTDEIDIFRKASTHFKSLCQFILLETENPHDIKVIFQPDEKSPEYEKAELNHTGTFTFPILRDWANYKCVPIVREINFENAEELTEEGIPLFIFFYKNNEHVDLIKKFKKLVNDHFIQDLVDRKMNFVTANGVYFEHPLKHLEKTIADVPLIAIDSLVHMFIYPYTGHDDLINKDKIKKFLEDYYTERLHLRFHHFVVSEDEIKPNDTIVPPEAAPQMSGPGSNNSISGPAGEVSSSDSSTETSHVPPLVVKSDFIKLYPSDKRYTLKKRIRDEL